MRLPPKKSTKHTPIPATRPSARRRAVPRREGFTYLDLPQELVNDRLAGSPVPRAAREAGVALGGILNRDTSARRKPLRPMPGGSAVPERATRAHGAITNVPGRRKPLRPLSKPVGREIGGLSGNSASEEFTSGTLDGGGLGHRGLRGTVEKQDTDFSGQAPKSIRPNVSSNKLNLDDHKSSQEPNRISVDADDPVAPDAVQQKQLLAESSSPLLSRVDAEIEPLRKTLEDEKYPNAGVRLSDPIRAFGLLNHIDDPHFDGAASTLGFPPERLISAHAILTAHPDDRDEIFVLLRETVLNDDGAVTDVALFDHYRVALNQVLEDGSVASRVDATLNLLNRFAMTEARKALTDVAPNGVMARGGEQDRRQGQVRVRLRPSGADCAPGLPAFSSAASRQNSPRNLDEM